jgi:hypothetical protein
MHFQKTLPNYHVSNVRPTSPSVKQLVRQYYHNRDRERKQKEMEEIQKSLPDFQEENEENQVVSDEEAGGALLNDEEELVRITSNTGSLASRSSADNSSLHRASSSSMSSNPQPKFKLEARKTDELYAKNTRPRTVPHEIYNDESIAQEIELLSQMSSAQILSASDSSESRPKSGKLSKEDFRSEGALTYMNERPDGDAEEEDEEEDAETEIEVEKSAKTATNDSNSVKTAEQKDDNDDVIVASRAGTSLSQNPDNIVEIKDDEEGGAEGENPDEVAAQRKVASAKKPPKDKLEKALSDIYPAFNYRNAIMNEAHDLRHEMKERRENANADDMRLEYETATDEAKLAEQELKMEMQRKKNEEAMARVKGSNTQGVQVTSYDLNKYVRKVMENQKQARRLEYSEMLAERLVTSALLAGSDDNITVNCILLPRCNFF